MFFLTKDFVEPFSNFSTYRGALEKAISQANASKDGPHCWVVPFFSLMVKDIYFMHEGMNDKDAKGFIRFEKCMSLARLVSKILSYKDRVVRGTTLSMPGTLGPTQMCYYDTFDTGLVGRNRYREVPLYREAIQLLAYRKLRLCVGVVYVLD